MTLSWDEAEQKSKHIAEVLWQNIHFPTINNIHVYLPILSKKEINTYHFVEKVRREYPHIQLLTSVTDLDTHQMHTVILEANTPIQENRWGIPEPVGGTSFAEIDIDMVIIPLLCLDFQGNRVGYGKGHYDRFLSNCRKDMIKIGLSYFAPVPLIEGLEATDIPLNAAVAQDKFLEF